MPKGEWIYAQSIQTLPFPSWMFVGITDNLTAQIDLLPWIFGAFSELKKPIPSINFRYQVYKQKGILPSIGFETMFIHFWDTLLRFETPELTVWEKGSYFHFKTAYSYKIGQNFFINLSLGVDFIGELTMQNNKSIDSINKTFLQSWNPNYALGFDYRPSPWISYHLGYSYGSTLTYLENVPRKHQLNYGFRIAPFYKNKRSLLKNFRVELLAINAFFSDIEAKQVFPLPVFPYFYWQWNRNKK